MVKGVFYNTMNETLVTRERISTIDSSNMMEYILAKSLFSGKV